MNSVKEGEYITLDTGVITDKNDLIMWYFNGKRLAYFTGGPEIWKSPSRFSKRLQLDYQTGSLNITNIKTTDSGLYKLEITNSSSINTLLSISSRQDKIFHVIVSGEYSLVIQ
ncbi:SLAM family member 6 [Labeo rohita]|uniref:SLAM family member 6 n=1 Tax=Labeo rohita TaxID=84645 RepID=A0ABQ8L897_LABRO|nr:SLAM family member 6 [Labeo rohita]